MAMKQNIKATVIDPDDYDPTELPNAGVAVFILACFGQGEPTSNAEELYYWLIDGQRVGERDFFDKVNYLVFGLGQSQHYPDRYQVVGKLFDSRLQELGAHRLFLRGEGDDSVDIEEDFEQWAEQLLAVIGNGQESATQSTDTPGTTTPSPPPASTVTAATATATSGSNTSPCATDTGMP
jgi:sulfite reductase alpha subunit-like flavoprotein